MEWRRINRGVHRDLGYFCVGLTLLFAVTGLLLNHIHDWNPMYAIAGQAADVGRIDAKNADEAAAVVLKRLSIDRVPLSTIWASETSLEIFLEGGDKIGVDLSSGKAFVETVKKRTITSRLNDLHLNKPKGGWTWISDLYAVSLAGLAISGALLAFRKNSVSRRGIMLTGLGAAVALLSVLLAT